MRFYWFRGINNGLTVFVFMTILWSRNLGWAGATFFLARNLDSFSSGHFEGVVNGYHGPWVLPVTGSQ